MKLFNPKSKMAVTSRFTLLSILFTHGLLITACNHAGTYHVIQDQGSIKEAPCMSIAHKYSLEVEKKSMGPQELYRLYNQIYESQSQHYRQDPCINDVIAFKEAAANENIPFHTALKTCSIRTGKMLLSCHLCDGMRGRPF